MVRASRLVGLLAIAGMAVTAAALAGDPPDFKVNPRDGLIEIANTVWDSNNFELEYVDETGTMEPPRVTRLTANPRDDRRARMDVAASGDRWVVWWRDDGTDRVLVRKRPYASGSWSAERTVSSPTESSRNPDVAHDGTRAVVAYEFDDGANTGIGVSVITDEPDPIGLRIVVATTTRTGPIDTRIHGESGRLWVTWIDSTSQVGWSEYDHATGAWGLPDYESYAGDSVAAARNRIRSTIVGD